MQERVYIVQTLVIQPDSFTLQSYKRLLKRLLKRLCKVGVWIPLSRGVMGSGGICKYLSFLSLIQC